jgi:aromatic ring-opening dioxygenase catalytic subunit (LigB family)
MADDDPTPARMPVVFAPHGGGPWPFIDNPFGAPEELNALAGYLRSLASLPKSPPRAILMISAHWEEPFPTVMTAKSPPMLYDYYGFPAEAYTVQWPAPGHPELAARVRTLLEQGGFKTAADPQRGFDHGAFVPLKLSYPQAEVPTFQLSLKRGLDPNEQIAMGRAIAPLRDEGVFIIGSGMTFHNLRLFTPEAAPYAESFDQWLRATMTLDETRRHAALAQWSKAPAARIAQPREEHLLPLMVIAGAAGPDVARVAFNGTILNLRLSAYHFGE